MRITGQRLPPYRAEGGREIVANGGLHHHRVLDGTELLVSTNIRDYLWNTYSHLLELTESPSLPVGGGNPYIRRVIKHIDLLVLEGHVLRRNNETLGKLIDGHSAQLEFTREQLEQPPPTLLTLIANTQEIQGLGRVLDEQFHECHDEDVVALAWLIPIEIQK